MSKFVERSLFAGNILSQEARRQEARRSFARKTATSRVPINSVARY